MGVGPDAAFSATPRPPRMDFIAVSSSAQTQSELGQKMVEALQGSGSSKAGDVQELLTSAEEQGKVSERDHQGYHPQSTR
jgi:hypothetical protein